MADAAQTSRPITVRLTEAEYAWLERKARRDGISREQVVSAVIRERSIRETEHEEGRERVLVYLGDAAEVTPTQEAAILQEIRGTE